MSSNAARSTRPSAARTATATLAGTTLEWYDFFLYGTAAALIFDKQFFPSLSPAAGTLAAFATFAVGFIARPVGGLLFGHFGDRIGRRNTLVVSLLVMGIGSTLIGVIPTYATIGFWAPVLLVVLRILQGIGLGGEMAGATLLSMEHAPTGRRNLYAGFPQMGTPAGLILANLVFLGVNVAVGDSAFAAWGWRIPFLISIVLVVIGLVIRLRVTESPAFERVRARDDVVRFPLGEAVRIVGLPRMLLTLFAIVANAAIAYLYMVFTLSYATKYLGFGKQFLVLWVSASAVLWFATIPLWTRVADRFGRRTMFVGGAAALLVWSAVYFPLLAAGTGGAVLAMIGMGLIIPVTHSVQGAIVADTFPAHVRYSGASLVLQISTILGGGLAPIIATSVTGADGSSTGVTVYMVTMCAVSLVGALVLFRVLAKERAAEPAPAAADAEPTAATS